MSLTAWMGWMSHAGRMRARRSTWSGRGGDHVVEPEGKFHRALPSGESLEGVQGLVDGGVADGMDLDLDSAPEGFIQEGPEQGIFQVELSPCSRGVGIVNRQGRAAAAEGPVQEELEPAEADPVVAVAALTLKPGKESW